MRKLEHNRIINHALPLSLDNKLAGKKLFKDSLFYNWTNHKHSLNRGYDLRV